MIRGLHIETTNLCTLKCPGCARTRFLDQWPQHWKNHSLDIDQVLKFLDIKLTNLDIILCGNYGDPIYHPDLIDFVKQLKVRGANIVIVTNGSYKTREWWAELAQVLTDKDSVIFSVDGTPDNFTNYRINADWNSIKLGIEIMTQSPATITWKYIPFAYNQTDIDQVRQLSQDLGVDNFVVTPSDRYDELTDQYRPDDHLLGSKILVQTEWKKSNHINLKIDPRCKSGKEHYISAEGFYSSCCFVADHRFYYKSQFGKNKKEYSIVNHSLNEILNRQSVVDFYQNLPQHTVCQYSCPQS